VRGSTLRDRKTVCVSEPLVPVNANGYVPAEVADVVVIVSEGVAGGVAESGLGEHTGGLVVTGLVPVSVQVNMTGLSKPEDGWRSIVPVADPPGFTAGVMSPPGRLMVKSCP
jgi:hypothetical protein